MAADDHVQVVTVGHRQEAPAMNEPPDVNEELAEIIRESKERGYRGTLGSPEGQTCEREGW